MALPSRKVYSPIVITTYAQCVSMHLSMALPSRKGYSLIVITTYAQCLSKNLFMVLPSRKGLQSDFDYHICSMFVNVSVHVSPIKKGLTV